MSACAVVKSLIMSYIQCTALGTASSSVKKKIVQLFFRGYNHGASLSSAQLRNDICRVGKKGRQVQ